ncbi:MAG: cyclic nucleotide-binding domain-containing protein, partial [Clostridiales Family XIII bacterium]|nr:cyclic nucleotide-binding domain-containing protein [Clostridiales Family XIII bacterium]
MLRTNKDSIEYAIKPLFRIRSRYTGPSHWEKIFHSKSPKFYAKGDVIVSQGEDNQNIFYIDMGLVEYTYTDKTGAENLIEVLGEGNMLNLQPVFGKNPSIATFFALTDSKLYALSATEVREHMMKDKFLVEELLEEMAIVIGGLNRQSCISTEKSNSRLLQILFMLAASSLALNTGFQILDRAFMEEDEYDEFLSDPSHFLMTKVFPRRH